MMKCLYHSLSLRSSVPILFGMAISCITLAGTPVGLPVQENSEAQLFWTETANTTNRIIVKHRQTAVGSATISAVAQQVSQATGHVMKHMGVTGTGARVFILDELLSIEDAQEIALEIETNPAIEYAEPDKWAFPLYTPNDPRYSEQWHYYEDTAGIRLPEAWDSTTGENVIIAVVDSGYTDHPDLLDNLQLPGIDLISSSIISNDGDARDQDAHDPGDWSADCGWTESTWHGTHTAGIAAAVGDNGIGVTGVAYNARILPVRVLGTCGGWLSDIADGIIWAAGGALPGLPVNETPAQVINVSTGGSSDGCSQFMQDAVNTALDMGSTVIAAAGNTNSEVAGVAPANCIGVITVAATDSAGDRAYFSNHGTLVDIAAPGVRVLSTLNSGVTTPEAGNYEYYQGTSMATPQVSGVAALLYSIRPDITPSEVEQILKDSARPFPGECSGCGVGVLDATAAVAAVIVNDPDPQPDYMILENGITQHGLAGMRDESLLFAIEVPDNANNLEFTISGGNGDADLYVQYDSEPSLERFDCRPYLTGNEESCSIANPQPGRYYALIHGYMDFSDLSITARYDTDSAPPPDPTVNRYENNDDYTIPDFGFSGAASTIEVPYTGVSGTVDVHVKIIHPAMNEVYIWLTAPNGANYWLRLGEPGTDLDHTFSLDLGNIQAQGNWVLKAVDFGFSGNGYIDSWSIEFIESSP